MAARLSRETEGLGLWEGEEGGEEEGGGGDERSMVREELRQAGKTTRHCARHGGRDGVFRRAVRICEPGGRHGDDAFPARSGSAGGARGAVGEKEGREEEEKRNNAMRGAMNKAGGDGGGKKAK